MRQEAAARWLIESAASVAEIGYLCGYADQPHFTREFKRHVGVTPGRFRADFGRSP